MGKNVSLFQFLSHLCILICSWSTLQKFIAQNLTHMMYISICYSILFLNDIWGKLWKHMTLSYLHTTVHICVLLSYLFKLNETFCEYLPYNTIVHSLVSFFLVEIIFCFPYITNYRFGKRLVCHLILWDLIAVPLLGPFW